VLDALEGKLLCSCSVSATLVLPVVKRASHFFRNRGVGIGAYLELGDNVGNTEEGRLLKGEHGVVALHVKSAHLLVLEYFAIFPVTHVERCEFGAVCVEGLVVVLDELLCFGKVSKSQAEIRGRI
jgi:hypothetical protein